MKPKCGLDGCSKDHYAKGYCQAHYNRLWQSGKISNRPISKPRYNRVRGKCSLPGCDSPHFANKLCQIHYQYVRWATVATEDQRECSVYGCKFVHCAKGYCQMNYMMAKATVIKNAAGL